MTKRLRTTCGTARLRPGLPEIEGIVFPPMSTAPAGPSQGQVYYDDGTNTASGRPNPMWYNGTAWKEHTDYDQGTFLPTLSIGTGTVTLNASSKVNWFRIGDLITYQGYINVASVSTPSGTVDIETFPKAASSAAPLFSMCNVVSSNVTLSAQQIAGRIAPSGVGIRLVTVGTSTAAFGNLNGNAFSTGDILYFNGSYHTDAA